MLNAIVDLVSLMIAVIALVTAVVNEQDLRYLVKRLERLEKDSQT